MRRFLVLALLALLPSLALAQCDPGWPLGTKPTTDAPDDGFEASVLDPKWTAVFGSAGTVDLFRTTATVAQVYDLSTLPGVLLMQNSKSGEDMVALRQDWTLCDGCSIQAQFAISTGGTENAYAVGIALNDDDSGPLEGEWYQAFIDAENKHLYRVLTVVTGRVHLNATAQPDKTSNPSARPIIRIIRQGLTYTSWYTNDDGITWSHFGTREYAAPLDNVWIFDRIGSGASQLSAFHTPIEAALWFCAGGAGYNPW